MRTHTGRIVDPFHLQEEDIAIEDIAHHLSNICRFNGATAWHYSVAQHSVYVASLCDNIHKMAGLLHDASEAYLTDVPRPIKYTSEFTFYRELEKQVTATIFSRFGVSPSWNKDYVKERDQQMLLREGIKLLNIRYNQFLVIPADVEIHRLAPEEAKHQFLATFQRLIAAPFYTGAS